MREKRKACAKCGTRKEDWEEDPFAFIGDMETCTGCEILEQTQEEVPAKAKGVKTLLVPRELYMERLEQQLNEDKPREED